MTSLPAHLEALETDLAGAAGRRVGQLRRRRRMVRTAAVVVTLLVMTGAGLAASGAGIFGWLASGEPGEARFSIDAGRVYEGPLPPVLRCDGSDGTLSCGAGSTGPHVYDLLMRVERPPTLTRQGLLDGLAGYERSAQVSPQKAAEVRALVLAVPDDFFEKLATLLALHSIGAGGSSPTGQELVPPAGVPLLVVCEHGGSTLSCRNLAGAEGVAVGAPVYRLRETPDWIPAPPDRPPSDVQADVRTTIESVWGRPLSDIERALLSVFASPATSASVGAAEVASPAPVTVPAP